jgi:hypothetical protein
MKKNIFWVMILTISIVLSSCAMAQETFRAESAIAVDQSMGLPMPASEAPSMEMAEESVDAEYSDGSSYESTSTNSERIVIKNANLSLVVVDPSHAMDTITKMAEAAGGFVVNSNLYKTTTSQGTEVPNANITIRVPSDVLDQTLNKIKELVEDPKMDILNEEISGQDVTSEVTDLESRLRNLEAAETQLLAILENATDTEDVLVVFRELTSVREEIELIQGQIKYYRESARLSAISVFLQAKAALEPISIAGWRPGVEAQNALQALVNGGQLIADFLIWLVLFAIPILAIIFLPIFFLVRFLRKRKQKKNSEKGKKEK